MSTLPPPDEDVNSRQMENKVGTLATSKDK